MDAPVFLITITACWIKGLYQRLIGFLESRKFLRGLRILGVAIGMELQGFFAIGLFDLGQGGSVAPRQPEWFVGIVAFHGVRVGKVGTMMVKMMMMLWSSGGMSSDG